MTSTPQPLGALRSVAIACSPDTGSARTLVDLAAAPKITVDDGVRWTTYTAPDLTVTLAAPAELPPGATVSLNIKVGDLEQALRSLASAGATVCTEPTEGAHEVRASVWISAGVALTIYQPR